jgi:hypothetical protein
MIRIHSSIGFGSSSGHVNSIRAKDGDDLKIVAISDQNVFIIAFDTLNELTYDYKYHNYKNLSNPGLLQICGCCARSQTSRITSVSP